MKKNNLIIIFIISIFIFLPGYVSADELVDTETACMNQIFNQSLLGDYKNVFITKTLAGDGEQYNLWGLSSVVKYKLDTNTAYFYNQSTDEPYIQYVYYQCTNTDTRWQLKRYGTYDLTDTTQNLHAFSLENNTNEATIPLLYYTNHDLIDIEGNIIKQGQEWIFEEEIEPGLEDIYDFYLRIPLSKFINEDNTINPYDIWYYMPFMSKTNDTATMELYFNYESQNDNVNLNEDITIEIIDTGGYKIWFDHEEEYVKNKLLTSLNEDLKTNSLILPYSYNYNKTYYEYIENPLAGAFKIVVDIKDTTKLEQIKKLSYIEIYYNGDLTQDFEVIKGWLTNSNRKYTIEQLLDKAFNNNYETGDATTKFIEFDQIENIMLRLSNTKIGELTYEIYNIMPNWIWYTIIGILLFSIILALLN